MPFLPLSLHVAPPEKGKIVAWTNWFQSLCKRRLDRTRRSSYIPARASWDLRSHTMRQWETCIENALKSYRILVRCDVHSDMEMPLPLDPKVSLRLADLQAGTDLRQMGKCGFVWICAFGLSTCRLDRICCKITNSEWKWTISRRTRLLCSRAHAEKDPKTTNRNERTCLPMAAFQQARASTALSCLPSKSAPPNNDWAMLMVR